MPTHEGEYAQVGVVAEVTERARLPRGVTAVSLNALHRAVLGYASGIFVHLGTHPWTVGATLLGYFGARTLGHRWVPPWGARWGWD